jgi:hypothetical protein
MRNLTMKRRIVLVTACVICVGLVAEITAQEPRRAPAPLPGTGPLVGEPVILDLTKPKNPTIVLDTVEVIGCVSQAPDNKRWALTKATKPLKSGTSATTVEALKAAETKPLGTDSYVLIGADGWKPANSSGAKVAVRGMVIKDTSESRVNVASFNKVADNCQ